MTLKMKKNNLGLVYRKNHYHSYLELETVLQSFQTNFPDYLRYYSIGLTKQNRKIWLVEMTNFKTGSAEAKPGFWVDANTHASEISGTESCLYIINKFLVEKKTDKLLSKLLDEVSFFIVPRICPDGAEYYLKTNHEIRSSLEVWPLPQPPQNFVPQDIDSDGQILTIRKVDPAGTFKMSQKNKKIMIQRKHDDFQFTEQGEKFYSLYAEGLFQADKKEHIHVKNFAQVNGFDLNRSYPVHFRPDGQQLGAGPYPGYLVESQTVVKAFTEKNRVFGHLTLHTYGGLILRPPGSIGEEHFSESDISILNQFKDRASQVSGYVGVNTFKEFKYTDRDVNSGSFDDWTFQHRGVFSSVIEIWDVWKAAGVEVKNHTARYFDPKESELLAIFAWAKKHFKESLFYSNWKKFNHPQFGEVEIGGWKKERLFRNPPEKLLDSECEKVFQILLSQAKAAPLVSLAKQRIEKLGSNQFVVTLTITNAGFLPTNGSDQAIKIGAVKKPRIKVNLSKNQKIISGQTDFEIDHLKGRSRYLPWHTPLGFLSRSNSHEVTLQWTVKGKGHLEINFDFQRGGLKTVFIELK